MAGEIKIILSEKKYLFRKINLNPQNFEMEKWRLESNIYTLKLSHPEMN